MKADLIEYLTQLLDHAEYRGLFKVTDYPEIADQIIEIVTQHREELG